MALYLESHDVTYKELEENPYELLQSKGLIRNIYQQNQKLVRENR